MLSKSLIALATSLSFSHAVYQGFNFASTKPDNSIMQLDDWKAAFTTQSSLDGTNGAFTSARLYTMIMDASASTPQPILALQAAKDDGKTTLLLGLWTSGGQSGVDKEIAALKSAIQQFPDLASQIVGISVGSEDLYRVSNIANKTNAANPDKPLGPGVFPDVMLSYINQVKGNLTGNWAKIPIGHVDTWTAYTNDDGSFNQDDLTKLIQSLDFLGIDSYPYFQGTMPNDISQSTDLFNTAYQKVLGVAGGRDVWITETGWPSKGDTINLAQANTQNAQTYWDNVGCANFGKINTWWYTLADAPATPSFGVVSSLSGGSPIWNLSCDGFTNQKDAAQATVGSNGTSTNSTSSGNSTSGNGSISSGSSTTNGSSSGSSGLGSSGSSNSSGSGSGSSSGSGSTSGSGNKGSKESGSQMVAVSSFVALAGAFVALMATM